MAKKEFYHFRFYKSEPRLIKEILNDYFENSNEPLAKAYRGLLFTDIFPNTELGIDLKLFTCTPGRMDIGEARTGKIVHDSEDHFTFIEDAVLKVLEGNKGSKKNATKRNPIYLPGKLINVHQKDDGTFYTTFCRPAFSPDFNFRDFCLQAAMELISISGLVEKL